MPSSDVYAPRKCSATGRLITPKDHSSAQIRFAEVNESTGVYTGECVSFVLSGFVRAQGESDDSINRLATQEGLLKSVWVAQK